MIEHPVVQLAIAAFKQRITGSASVSEHTRNAQAIAKTWRRSVFELDSDRFHYEVPVAPDFDQRIDILDREAMHAFEFKVSGKNAAAEFYKDVVKVMLWNARHASPIKRLVFVTEGSYGRRHLDTPMPHAYIGLLEKQGLDIDIVYV